jgi:hypothetical protein
MTRVKSLATKFSQRKSKWLSKLLVLASAISLAAPLSISLCLQALLPPPAMSAKEEEDSQESTSYLGAGGAATRAAAVKASPLQVMSIKARQAEAPSVGLPEGPKLGQGEALKVGQPGVLKVGQPGVLKVGQIDAGKVSKAVASRPANFVSPFDVLCLPTAVQFPVVFDTGLDSRKTRQGDLIECHLKEDLVFESRLIAPAGSIVLGHVDHYVKSRTMTEAMSSKDQRFHKTSIVKMSFDEIITPELEHIKIVGILSQQRAIFGDKEEREVVVGKKGVVDMAEPKLSDDAYVGAQVVNFTVGTGLSQLGAVATFGVLPLVMGAIGAVNPSIITMKATSDKEPHPRLRGLTMGVVSSLPGGPVLQSFIYRGSELNIKVGDELLMQAHSPYNDQTTTTQVAAKIFVGKQAGAGSGQSTGRRYYPKYLPKYTPKAGNKVYGTHAGSDDRFGLWQ